MSRHFPIDPILEENYNLRLKRDDVETVLEDWVDRSEVFRSIADSTLHCPYGEAAADRIDFFRCGKADAPLYVFIHGGYWQRGDKSNYSFIAEPFTESNVDVALIGYQLCPGISMAGLVAKIRDAVVWIYCNAAELGVSAERINLSGHSAGGHLTAMGLATCWPELGEDLPPDLVKSGIPFSGLYQLEPILHTTISDALHLTDTEVEALSPHFLQASTSAPVLAIVGGAETPEFFRQTDELIEQWSGPDLIMEKHVEANVDHFDLLNRLANRESEMFQRIRAWLK